MKVRYSMRQIPKKNYFYLLILIVITVILTLGFFNVYKNYSHKEESYLSQHISSINSLDLNSLLIENSLLFVYVDDRYNNKDNAQEEELLKSLKKDDMNKYFVFYANNSKKNQKYMLKTYNVDIKDRKMLLVFEDNKLVVKHALGKKIDDEIMKIVYDIEGLND